MQCAQCTQTVLYSPRGSALHLDTIDTQVYMFRHKRFFSPTFFHEDTGHADRLLSCSSNGSV